MDTGRSLDVGCNLNFDAEIKDRTDVDYGEKMAILTFFNIIYLVITIYCHIFTM